MHGWEEALATAGAMTKEFREDLPLASRAALYAAMLALMNEMETFYRSEHDARELKACMDRVREHTSAALGFGARGGHSVGDHRVWTVAALSSLMARLKQD